MTTEPIGTPGPQTTQSISRWENNLESCESTEADIPAALNGSPVMEAWIGIFNAQCNVNGIEQPESFMDPNHEPDPVPCPYCGKPLHHRSLGYAQDIFLGWCPAPDACDNPECRRLEAETQKQEEHRKRMKALYERMPGSGIPEEYAHATTQNFDVDRPELRNLIPAVQTVREYITRFRNDHSDGQGLYLCGPIGTGKTHLAATIARGCLYYDFSVVFVSSVDLTRRLMGSFGVGSTEEIMKAYKNCDLLVLDDIGKEYATAIVLNMLAEIISARYVHRRPTIFTSNFVLESKNPTQMDLLGALMRQGGSRDSAEAILSRIRGRCSVVPMVSKIDYRSLGN